MLIGKIDNANGESIQTAFKMGGLIVAPMASYWVVSTKGRRQVIEIERNDRSVRLGYLRSVAPVVAGFLGYGAVTSQSLAFAVLASATVALWLWSLLGAGRLPARERLRRQLRFDLIGTGMPPDLLPYETTEAMRDQLLTRWLDQHPGESWEAAIGRGETSELLFHLAEYYERGWMADEVYERLQRERAVELA